MVLALRNADSVTKTSQTEFAMSFNRPLHEVAALRRCNKGDLK